MWMSRMTYFSADEVRTIVKRLRKEGYPCDVIHLDSGYFANDWVCDWKFSPNTFPNPSDFIREMRRDGIPSCVCRHRISERKIPLPGGCRASISASDEGQ
jgi:alpha-glucosidase (family GH31 glycosyl hydrolase)